VVRPGIRESRPQSLHSFNRYAYGNNNPLRFRDPDGRDARAIVAVAIGLRLSVAIGGQAARSAIVSGAQQALGRTIGLGAACVLAGVCTLSSAENAASGSTTPSPLDRSGSSSDEKPSLVEPDRAKHILEGDKSSGGHRAGTGKRGKSESPSSWSDEKILGEISDVATDPKASTSPGRGGRELVRGTRDGVDIEVVKDRNGRIVTGYPTNTPRNP
jgi:hypothetical protein